MGLLFANRDQAPLFLRRAQRSGEFTEICLSTDLTLASTQVQVWCPSEAPDPIFSTRAAGRALMRADGLQAWTQLRSGRDPGAGVFVIVVDQGLDRAFLEAEHPGAYAGGWGSIRRLAIWAIRAAR